MAGIIGRRVIEAMVVVASGMEKDLNCRRHGIVPGRLLGAMVRVIAYDNRR